MKLNIKNIITSLLLLFPAWVFADVHTGIELTKEATYDYSTQTGIITLESFVGQVTKTISPNPADVVLVLDLSRSMEYSSPDSRPILKSAVTSFVNTLYASYEENSALNHRVSVVFFGGTAALKCDFQPVSQILTSGNTSTLGKCIEAIEGASISGTRPDYGLKLAQYVMAGSTALPTESYFSFPSDITSLTGTNDERNHYVVLMTDGVSDGGNDAAITSAYNLKNDTSSPADIYCVSFLDNTELSNDDRLKVSHLLNLVSSNYPAAVDETYKNDYLAHDYYAEVNRASTDAAATLNSMFSTISDEIVAGCAAVNLTSATVTDVINDEYFKLPAGVDASNIGSKIKAYTVPCTNCVQTSAGPVYTFNESSHTDATGLTVTLTNSTKITVSGFDFTDNWCGLEYSSGSTVARGKKLVLEIPYTVKNYEGVTAEVPTNAAGSGFNGAISGGGTLSQAYGTPTIPLFELTVTRKGLRAGESAIYTIRDKDDKVLNTIVLTGTGSDVKQKVLYVPDGAIKVEETNWGWNNSTSSTNPQSYTLSTTNPSHEYIFNGASSPGKQNANPEDHKKNEFSK